MLILLHNSFFSALLSPWFFNFTSSYFWPMHSLGFFRVMYIHVLIPYMSSVSFQSSIYEKGAAGDKSELYLACKIFTPLECMLISTKHVYFIRAEATFLHPCSCLHFLELLVAKHEKSLE